MAPPPQGWRGLFVKGTAMAGFTVRALTAHKYGGKRYVPGQTYQIRQRDLRALRALKMVEETGTPAPAAPPKAEAKPRVAAKKVAKSETAEKPQTYRTRVLKAEGDLPTAGGPVRGLSSLFRSKPANEKVADEKKPDPVDPDDIA
jgi:hypothetical protein